MWDVRANFGGRKSELPSIIGGLVIKQKRDGPSSTQREDPPVDLNLGLVLWLAQVGLGGCLKELCLVRLWQVERH